MNDLRFKPKVINFFGGPGAGKSTMSTLTFAELKLKGYNSELIQEYAKDATWEKRGHKVFAAQDYIFAKQHFRLSRVAEEVDFVVTDAPLLLSLAYIPPEFGIPSLRQVIIEAYNQYDNLNLFVLRSKDYNPSGRNQTEDQAKELDNRIMRELIDVGGIDITMVNYGRNVPEKVLELMRSKGWVQ